MMWARLTDLFGNLGPLDRNLTGVAIGVATLAFLVSNSATVISLHERLFDSVVNLGASSLHGERPIVIDIDRATLENVGPWPWSRDKVAQLVGLIADAGPKVVALDILFDGPDLRSPAALARGLADVTGEDSLRELAGRLV